MNDLPYAHNLKGRPFLLPPILLKVTERQARLTNFVL